MNCNLPKCFPVSLDFIDNSFEEFENNCANEYTRFGVPNPDLESIWTKGANGVNIFYINKKNGSASLPAAPGCVGWSVIVSGGDLPNNGAPTNAVIATQTTINDRYDGFTFVNNNIPALRGNHQYGFCIKIQAVSAINCDTFNAPNPDLQAIWNPGNNGNTVFYINNSNGSKNLPKPPGCVGWTVIVSGGDLPNNGANVQTTVASHTAVNDKYSAFTFVNNVIPGLQGNHQYGFCLRAPSDSSGLVSAPAPTPAPTQAQVAASTQVATSVPTTSSVVSNVTGAPVSGVTGAPIGAPTLIPTTSPASLIAGSGINSEVTSAEETKPTSKLVLYGGIAAGVIVLLIVGYMVTGGSKKEESES